MRHVCVKAPKNYEISYVWGQWKVICWDFKQKTTVPTTTEANIGITYNKRELISEIEYCPYCGKDLDEERSE